MGRGSLCLLALSLLAVACGGSATTSTTTAAPPTTTEAAPSPTRAPSTSTLTIPASTTTSPTTVPAPAATTTAPGTTTTETVTTETVTTETVTIEAGAVVAAKTAAVEAALPAGWEFSTRGVGGTDGESDIVFAPCLGPDDFDLDRLDDVSLAALQTNASGPPDPPFPGPEATVEARVFDSLDLTDSAFATLQKVLGTAAGRECLTTTVSAAVDAPAGTEFSFAVEGRDIPFADVAARVRMDFEVQEISGTIYVDLAAAVDGQCTVFATFLAFTDPFPPDLAGRLFGAAING